MKVYDLVSQRARPELADRFRALDELGFLSGTLAVILVAMQYLFFMCLCYIRPASSVDVCPDFLFEEWVSRRTKIEPLPFSEQFMTSLSKRRSFVMNGA